MINIYIVVEGGCVRYVSADTDAPISVDVIDIDDRNDFHAGDAAEFDARLKVADSMLRIW